LEGGPPCFPQDFSCPVVLRIALHNTPRRVRLRDSHPLRCRLPAASAPQRPVFLNLSASSNPGGPEGPPVWAAARLARHYCGPLPSPLPAEGATGTPACAGLLLISPPRGTEMFQFPRCPPRGLCIQPAVRALPRSRVAPFGSGRLIARLQLPVHVSPRAASFLGPWPLGIHPTPLLAWHSILAKRVVFSTLDVFYTCLNGSIAATPRQAVYLPHITLSAKLKETPDDRSSRLNHQYAVSQYEVVQVRSTAYTSSAGRLGDLHLRLKCPHHEQLPTIQTPFFRVPHDNIMAQQ
jgi:hypothetical protein